MTLPRDWSLSLIGVELLLAGAMAFGYMAFIQPTAPRNQQRAAAKAIPPVPVPVVPVEAATLGPAVEIGRAHV